MSAGKTGALIGASLALGALCASAPERDVQVLQAAGVEWTRSRPLTTRWPRVGRPAATGKPAGNDAARGKKSLPAVVAAECALPLGDPPSGRRSSRSHTHATAPVSCCAIRRCADALTSIDDHSLHGGAGSGSDDHRYWDRHVARVLLLACAARSRWSRTPPP
jgi:hypothetical protein